MTNLTSRPERIRTALFVDFDNIFISLRNRAEDFSKAFGENQESWLDWLENKLGNPNLGYKLDHSLEGRSDATAEGPKSFNRKILVRRCYLNPKTFADYRPYFIRSGFEVIDCPQLTAQGKTSTDIHLVIDVLDTLYRTAEFDEFIILSGDSDFTPLLLRLRMHDRRTAILSAGYASAAYKASCDYIIPTDLFTGEALGLDLPDEEPTDQIQPGQITSQNEELLQKMADKVFNVAVDNDGIQANDLPAVYNQFPEFRQSSHWLGYRSLRRLTEEIVSLCNELTIVEEDPWCVARVVQPKSGKPETAKVDESCEIDEAVKKTIADGVGNIEKESEETGIKQSIADCIKGIVEKAKGPVSLAVLANQISDNFSEQIQNSDWLGAGGFKKLLHLLDLGDLIISPQGPGYVYDPKYGEPPVALYTPMSIEKKMRQNLFSKSHPQMAQVAWKVHQFTDVPYLMPEYYDLLFKEIAREVNERGYQFFRTSKIVRDRCVEKEAPVSRANVNSILISLNNSGNYLKQKAVEPEKLAGIVFGHTLKLCKLAQLELKEEERGLAAQWITGTDSVQSQGLDQAT